MFQQLAGDNRVECLPIRQVVGIAVHHIEAQLFSWSTA